MVHVLEGTSRGSRLGEQLSKGIQEGAKFAVKLGLERQKNLIKNRAKMPAAIKTHLSLYDQNKFFLSNPEKMAQLDELSSKYAEAGFDPNEAVKLAYKDITTGGTAKKSETLGAKEEDKEGGSFFRNDKNTWSGSFSRGELPLFSEGGIGQDIKEVIPKVGRMGTEIANIPIWAYNKLNELKIRTFGKLMGKSDKEIDAEVKMKTPDLVETYDKLTGGKGIPVNESERFASSLKFGPAGGMAYGTEKGLEKAGAPEWAQQVGGILTFIVAHQASNSNLKSIAKGVETKAESTGKTPEAVLKESMEKSGVTEEQITSGDQAAIRALKDKITEAPEVTSKVKVTPKNIFNKKAAIKEREAFGSKLADSPLEAHYDIEAKNVKKEAGKGEIVRTREAEIRERLAPEEKKLFEDLRYKQEQLRRIEKEQLNATEPDAIARLKTHYEYQLRDLEKTSERLKDIQYEMKHGRARPTEAEIDAQIKKSVDAYEEGIKNPNEKTSKDIRRQLELDQQYLNRAQQILDRGELPGEIRPDTFIKMKDKYLKSYKAAIKEAKDTVQGLKGERDAASLKRVREQQDLIEILSGRVKRLEADIVNQTDKVKSLGALEKPSGAFYKNQIKSLKKDQALFKHDLFEHKIVKNPVEAKADAAFKKAREEFKSGEQTAKDPSAENIKKASEETGKSKETISEHIKEMREEVNGVKEKIEKGTATPKTESKFYKRAKRFTYLMGAGFAGGAVLGLVDEVLGTRINATIYRRALSAAGFKNLGPITIGRDMVRGWFEEAQANKLESLKDDPMAWNKYKSNLRNSYGQSKIKRIEKILREKNTPK